MNNAPRNTLTRKRQLLNLVIGSLELQDCRPAWAWNTMDEGGPIDTVDEGLQMIIDFGSHGELTMIDPAGREINIAIDMARDGHDMVICYNADDPFLDRHLQKMLGREGDQDSQPNL